ncbi:hypothetical protein [Methylosarcina fibrata]|uniref:hypothetical protein n=1 Tax=Methylosarcina fibrata TaxID=105972 RepID=UPI00037BAEDF|nr:hypothetical protein [Methylosarcina fibrata]
MWLFTNNSFLSIVDKGDPSGKTLLVRARCAGDIERLFPEAKIQVGGGTDYRYRARIDREEVATVMADSIRNIDYRNFKSTVSDPDRHEAYMDVWSAMYAFQSIAK